MRQALSLPPANAGGEASRTDMPTARHRPKQITAGVRGHQYAQCLTSGIGCLLMSEYTGPVPISTTDGQWKVGVAGSETGKQIDVELSLYRTDTNEGFLERQVFEFLPSAARKIGEMLIESADAKDSEYPSQPNR